MGLAGSLIALGCSGLLGYDDVEIKPAPWTPPDSSAGGASGSGGSAGSHAGGTGPSAGSGGSGASGGSAAGSGASAGTGPAAGSGGSPAGSGGGPAGAAGSSAGSGGAAGQQGGCDPRFSFSANPIFAGQGFTVTFTDNPQPAYVYVAMDVSGPGNPATTWLNVDGTGPYNWHWSVSGHGVGWLTFSMLKDRTGGSNGTLIATCKVESHDGGSGGSGGTGGAGGTGGTGGISGTGGAGGGTLVSPCGGGQYDVVAYTVPDCNYGGPNNQMNDGEQFQTVTLRNGGDRGYYFVKSADGKGFEEWRFDDSWVRIRRDTTWAFYNGSDWCDMTCSMDPPCLHRWAGDQGDWAATEYQDTSSTAVAAPMYKRCVADGEDFSTSYVVAAMHLADCSTCQAKYTGSTGHSVHVSHLGSWHGMDDVLQMQITGGSGSGEAYFYAKGRGWIGFTLGATEHYATGTAGAISPQDSCGGFALASVCQ